VEQGGEVTRIEPLIISWGHGSWGITILCMERHLKLYGVCEFGRWIKQLSFDGSASCKFHLMIFGHWFC